MQTSRKKSGDEKAVLNYIDSVIFGKNRVLENQFSNNLICDMYKIIKNDKNKEKDCCGFRRIQIFDILGAVGTNVKMYNPTAPQDIDVVMDDLIYYINRDDDIDKLIKTALAYYQFIIISPFENENKKMARMMISLLFQHNKILSKQLLCISSYILQDKISFDDRISTVRILGDYKQWVKAFLKGIIITAERTITIIDNLMQLKIRDEENVIDVAKSVKTSMLLLELLRQKPIIDIKETAKELNMAYNTVDKSVVDLQEMGILAESNNLLRNRCLVYKEYLSIFQV